MGIKDYWGFIKSFEKAIELNPTYHQAYNEIGLALFTLRKYEKALEYFNKSLELLPNNCAALNNRGLCHHELRNLSAATTDFYEAIKEDESNPNLHWNLALSLLTSGDMENGFKHYEWRFKTDQAKKTARTPTAEAWIGEASLINKTILIFSEQGFGDSIQFCRFINYIANCHTKVIFEVENQLFQLMSFLNNENIKVVRRGENLPYHDYQCALLSLPHALKISSNEMLFKKKYLQASKTKIEYWSSTLEDKIKPRVGIVWSGGIRPDDKENLLINDRRNIPLEKILAIENIQNIKLFSLQKGEPAESELERSIAIGRAGASIANYADQLLDFTDTAALIENLDLVISVDTAIAHLAGALGKPVWMLNRFDTDWRWLHDKNSTPWYPSMKIFRQSTPGNWDEVIKNVVRELRETI
jgi:tetratricopeptide (TPR) repeat protein